MGESPAPLFQTLVREGKRMSFLPAPGTEAGGPLAQPEETSGRPSVNQTDLKLQTALPSDLLQSRLLAIFHAARTSLEEQGVNTLFLALGMLHWFERDEPRGGLRAPLLLVPVELERSSARERFRLRPNDEDLEVNLSLAEKLRADFGIDFPELPESAALDVGRYFDAVAAAVGDQSGWSVDHDAVVLGFFSFGKFLMYRDLDEDQLARRRAAARTTRSSGPCSTRDSRRWTRPVRRSGTTSRSTATSRRRGATRSSTPTARRPWRSST